MKSWSAGGFAATIAVRFRRNRNLVIAFAAVCLLGCGSDVGPSGAATSCSSDEATDEPECIVRSAPRLTAALYAYLDGPFATNRRFDYINMGYDARAYPAEAAVVFWSGYRLTGDPAFLRAGESQLSYAKSLVDEGGYFQWPYPEVGQFSSNTLARLALGFYVGFLVTGNPSEIEYADRVAEAIMRLPETMVRSSFSGQYFLLPHYVYASPTEPASGRTLDPNQDASLGLLFTLLTAEPMSRLYARADAGERASRYLGAAMDPLSLGSCWPLADQPEFRGSCDSLYNWWTLYQLHWANRVAPRPGLQVLLADQYELLRVDLLNGLQRRAYPTFSYDALAQPTELWFALSVAADLGGAGDVDRIIQLIAAQADRYPQWIGIPGGFVVGYRVQGARRQP